MAVPWFRVFPPEPMNDAEFEGNVPGPIHMPPRHARPIVYFYLLFGLDLMKEFVKQTNRYAKQLCRATINTTRRFSRKKQWKKDGKLTVFEFKGFLAAFFNMGLIRKSTIEEYWNNTRFSQSTPWFRRLFSRNRIQSIFKFLHLVDNKKIPNRQDVNYKPCLRFKPLIDYVNRKFIYHYNPRRELAVDESLVGTKGKSAMIQYIPSKKSKFGVKFWFLVESVTGYILRMEVYQGKKYESIPVGTLQGTNVVMGLMEGARLFGKGYHVFVDNFFSSLTLARALFAKRTFLTGTIRKSSKLPLMIKNANPAEGQAIYVRQNNISLCCYKENRRVKKSVTLVSTFYNAIPTLNGKPRVIGAYNTFMGGVDLSDQMTGVYNGKRRACKVWKKVIYNIMHRIMLNAYLLYTQNTSDQPILSRLRFIQSVIDSLAVGQLDKRLNPRVNVERLNGVKRLDGRKEKDCIVCSDRKHQIRKRSKTACSRCSKGLHKNCLLRHEC